MGARLDDKLTLSHTMTSDTFFSFPSDLPVPAELRDLLRHAPGLLEGQVSGSFGFTSEPPETVARYFGDESSASARIAAQHLGVFGRGPDGSALAVWKAPDGAYPVVYLSSEGGGCALAADMRQFLRLLAVGYDEFALWNDCTEPPEEDGDVSPALRQWLHRQKLSVPDTGEDIVSDAQARWPDFNGWVEDAVADRLGDASSPSTSESPPSPPGAAPRVPATPWEHAIACLGRRIDDPLVLQFLAHIGAKPLKPCTPHNDSASVASKPKGIEVGTELPVRHRDHWPLRKEGRVWISPVTEIWLMPASAKLVPLPSPWDWARFPFEADGPDIVSRPLGDGLRITFMRDDDGRRIERITLSLPQEGHFIESNPFGEKVPPLHDVEDAFFATWCALNGLLDATRYPAETLTPWRERHVTPRQFLHGPCQGRLWSGDLAPGVEDFLSAYHRGYLPGGKPTPDAQRWNADVKTAFGSSNHFRDEGEAATPDDWASFDRVAALITQRWATWRARGVLA